MLLQLLQRYPRDTDCALSQVGWFEALECQELPIRRETEEAIAALIHRRAGEKLGQYGYKLPGMNIGKEEVCSTFSSR